MKPALCTVLLQLFLVNGQIIYFPNNGQDVVNLEDKKNQHIGLDEEFRKQLNYIDLRTTALYKVVTNIEQSLLRQGLIEKTANKDSIEVNGQSDEIASKLFSLESKLENEITKWRNHDTNLIRRMNVLESETRVMTSKIESIASTVYSKATENDELKSKLRGMEKRNTNVSDKMRRIENENKATITKLKDINASHTLIKFRLENLTNTVFVLNGTTQSNDRSQSNLDKIVNTLIQSANHSALQIQDIKYTVHNIENRTAALKNESMSLKTKIETVNTEMVSFLNSFENISSAISNISKVVRSNDNLANASLVFMNETLARILPFHYQENAHKEHENIGEHASLSIKDLEIINSLKEKLSQYGDPNSWIEDVVSKKMGNINQTLRILKRDLIRIDRLQTLALAEINILKSNMNGINVESKNLTFGFESFIPASNNSKESYRNSATDLTRSLKNPKTYILDHESNVENITISRQWDIEMSLMQDTLKILTQSMENVRQKTSSLVALSLTLWNLSNATQVKVENLYKNVQKHNSSLGNLSTIWRICNTSREHVANLSKMIHEIVAQNKKHDFKTDLQNKTLSISVLPQSVHNDISSIRQIINDLKENIDNSSAIANEVKDLALKVSENRENVDYIFKIITQHNYSFVKEYKKLEDEIIKARGDLSSMALSTRFPLNDTDKIQLAIHDMKQQLVYNQSEQEKALKTMVQEMFHILLTNISEIRNNSKNIKTSVKTLDFNSRATKTDLAKVTKNVSYCNYSLRQLALNYNETLHQLANVKDHQDLINSDLLNISSIVLDLQHEIGSTKNLIKPNTSEASKNITNVRTDFVEIIKSIVKREKDRNNRNSHERRLNRLEENIFIMESTVRHFGMVIQNLTGIDDVSRFVNANDQTVQDLKEMSFKIKQVVSFVHNLSADIWRHCNATSKQERNLSNLVEIYNRTDSNRYRTLVNATTLRKHWPLFSNENTANEEQIRKEIADLEQSIYQNFTNQEMRLETMIEKKIQALIRFFSHTQNETNDILSIKKREGNATEEQETNISMFQSQLSKLLSVQSKTRDMLVDAKRIQMSILSNQYQNSTSIQDFQDWVLNKSVNECKEFAQKRFFQIEKNLKNLGHNTTENQISVSKLMNFIQNNTNDIASFKYAQTRFLQLLNASKENVSTKKTPVNNFGKTVYNSSSLNDMIIEMFIERENVQKLTAMSFNLQHNISSFKDVSLKVWRQYNTTKEQMSNISKLLAISNSFHTQKQEALERKILVLQENVSSLQILVSNKAEDGLPQNVFNNLTSQKTRLNVMNSERYQLLTTNISNIKINLDEAQSLIQHLQSIIQKHTQNISECSSELSKLFSELEEIKVQCNKPSNFNYSFRSELYQISTSVEELKHAFNTSVAKYSEDTQKHVSEMQEHRSMIEHNLTEIQSLRDKSIESIQNNTNGLIVVRDTQNNLNKRLHNMEKNVLLITKTATNLEIIVSNLSSSNGIVMNASSANRQQVQDLKTMNVKLQRDITSLQTALHILWHQCNLTKEQVVNVSQMFAVFITRNSNMFDILHENIRAVQEKMSKYRANEPEIIDKLNRGLEILQITMFKNFTLHETLMNTVIAEKFQLLSTNISSMRDDSENFQKWLKHLELITNQNTENISVCHSAMSKLSSDINDTNVRIIDSEREQFFLSSDVNQMSLTVNEFQLAVNKSVKDCCNFTQRYALQLEKHVTGLSKNLTNFQRDLGDFMFSLQNHSKRILNLETARKKHKEQIDRLEGNISDITLTTRNHRMLISNLGGLNDVLPNVTINTRNIQDHMLFSLDLKNNLSSITSLLTLIWQQCNSTENRVQKMTLDQINVQNLRNTSVILQEDLHAIETLSSIIWHQCNKTKERVVNVSKIVSAFSIANARQHEVFEQEMFVIQENISSIRASVANKAENIEKLRSEIQDLQQIAFHNLTLQNNRFDTMTAENFQLLATNISNIENASDHVQWLLHSLQYDIQLNAKNITTCHSELFKLVSEQNKTNIQFDVMVAERFQVLATNVSDMKNVSNHVQWSLQALKSNIQQNTQNITECQSELIKLASERNKTNVQLDAVVTEKFQLLATNISNMQNASDHVQWSLQALQSNMQRSTQNITKCQNELMKLASAQNKTNVQLDAVVAEKIQLLATNVSNMQNASDHVQWSLQALQSNIQQNTQNITKCQYELIKLASEQNKTNIQFDVMVAEKFQLLATNISNMKNASDHVQWSLQALQSNMQQNTQNITECQSELIKLASERNKTNVQLDAVVTEKFQLLATNISNMKNASDHVQWSLQALQSNMQQNTQNITECQSELIKLTSERNKTNVQLDAVVAEKIQLLATNVSNLQNASDHVQWSLQALQSNIQQNTQNITRCQYELIKLASEQNKTNIQFDVMVAEKFQLLATNISNMKNASDHVQWSLQALQSNMQQNTQNITKCQYELIKLALAQNRTKVQLTDAKSVQRAIQSNLSKISSSANGFQQAVNDSVKECNKFTMTYVSVLEKHIELIETNFSEFQGDLGEVMVSVQNHSNEITSLYKSQKLHRDRFTRLQRNVSAIASATKNLGMVASNLSVLNDVITNVTFNTQITQDLGILSLNLQHNLSALYALTSMVWRQCNSSKELVQTISSINKNNAFIEKEMLNLQTNVTTLAMSLKLISNETRNSLDEQDQRLLDVTSKLENKTIQMTNTSEDLEERILGNRDLVDALIKNFTDFNNRLAQMSAELNLNKEVIIFVQQNITALFDRFQNVSVNMHAVVESGTTPTAQNVIRLVGGSSDREGRVEVFHGGDWGTVCDDSWDSADATVVCRMLGYTGSASAFERARFGSGTGKIILDEVRCSGVESSIFLCPHNGIEQHDCSHTEDAAVSCS